MIASAEGALFVAFASALFAGWPNAALLAFALMVALEIMRWM